VNCTVNSLSPLNEDRVIIWNNTDRYCSEEGFDYVIKRGFRKIDFVGMASMCDFKTQTSIFIELTVILVSNNKKKFRGV